MRGTLGLQAAHQFPAPANLRSQGSGVQIWREWVYGVSGDSGLVWNDGQFIDYETETLHGHSAILGDFGRINRVDARRPVSGGFRAYCIIDLIRDEGGECDWYDDDDGYGRDFPVAFHDS